MPSAKPGIRVGLAMDREGRYAQGSVETPNVGERLEGRTPGLMGSPHLRSVLLQFLLLVLRRYLDGMV